MSKILKALGAMVEASVEASKNAYTQEEKDAIIAVRNLLNKREKVDAVKALDKVISEMTYTRTDWNSFTGRQSTSEFASELRSKLPKLHDGYTFKVLTDLNNTVYIDLMLYGRRLARFSVVDRYYSGVKRESIYDIHKFEEIVCDAIGKARR